MDWLDAAHRALDAQDRQRFARTALQTAEVERDLLSAKLLEVRRDLRLAVLAGDDERVEARTQEAFALMEQHDRACAEVRRVLMARDQMEGETDAGAN
jgi:hypothetical protein